MFFFYTSFEEDTNNIPYIRVDTLAFCGDGIIEDTEACDDGNTLSGDGCSSDCLSVETGWTCNT